MIERSFCRACVNSCPMVVEVEHGRLRSATGDPGNELFAGYSCVKGRQQPDLYNHPSRLLSSRKRRADGQIVEVGVGEAMDEVAAALERIVSEHGPRAVACYVGTAANGNCLTSPFFGAFLAALGSRMKFTPNTIDKPGKSLALAMHGTWMAPLQGYHDPDVALVFGANPLKTYYGIPCGHPGKWLKERLAAGMTLMVVDPRRSDLAKRATVHLQPRPGFDPAILACLINVVLVEELFDRPFVEENVRGVEELRQALARFTPDAVSTAADVDPDELRRVARSFARARRGYAVCGVGPGFAKSSTLVEYLVLVLETLCGHWLRAGERVDRTTTLLPAPRYVAQAKEPTAAYGLGEVMFATSLTETTAGLPTGALADEILQDGPKRVRALLCVGGNPVLAWPDQRRTIDALRSLDLLVQFDPWPSSTALLADYVIAPTMAYEEPGMTLLTDSVIAMPTYYGPAEAYAQYTDAVVAPPPGADVIAEWRFIYGVAQRMGLELAIQNKTLTPSSSGAGVLIDMVTMPSAEELLEVLAADGRVPLAEVKRHRSGATFPDPGRYVEPKDAGWTGRLDVANPDMLADLDGEYLPDRPDLGPELQLISIREAHMQNSTVNLEGVGRHRRHNPAYLHPDDLERLGLVAGDEVEIRSAHGAIPALVEPAADLRVGLVAMAFGFGDGPGRDADFRQIGSSPARLLDSRDVADPYVGMPRMGAVPVEVVVLETKGLSFGAASPAE